MNLYDFGPDSNITIQAEESDVENYNRVVENGLNHEDDLEVVTSYLAVTALIGKSIMALILQGDEPVRHQKQLRIVPEGSDDISNNEGEL